MTSQSGIPPFGVRDAHEAIGRAIVHAAWLERTILGLRARLNGADDVAWQAAEQASVTENLRRCLAGLRAHRPQSDSTDDLFALVERAAQLFDQRHHLVHGLPRAQPETGLVIWRKHERRSGQNWTYVEMDASALSAFGTEVADTMARIRQVSDEIFPTVITGSTTRPDGTVTSSYERVTPAAPRNRASSREG